MKSLHKINTWAVAITAMLFIVPMLGMMAMIPLGILQLLLAAGIRLTYYNELDKKMKMLLRNYWLMVLGDLIAVFICYSLGHQYLETVPIIISLFIFPGFIAVYFAYTTYSITKYFNNLS